jgi:predicted neutral ceramidase superfamily lipid hydrolase
MKILIKALALSVIIYFLHFFLFYLLSTYSFQEVLGGFIYLSIFSWVYFIVIYLYVILSLKLKKKTSRILLVSIATFVGYFLSRVGDMIDGDFLSNFEIMNPIIFVCLGLTLFT